MTDTQTPEHHSLGDLLRHRPYTLFLSGRVMSSFAGQMQVVAVGWQVYALTGRPFDLGMVGLAQFLPMVVLTLLVGHVADHYDRRKVVALCRFTRAVCLALLALGTHAGWLDRNTIFAVVMVIGTVGAFDNPTTSAMLPTLIPRSILQQGIALFSSGTQAAQIIGPALGGWLYALNPVMLYALAAALFFLSGVTTWMVPSSRPTGNSKRMTLESVFSGIIFIRDHRPLLGAISLDLFAVLLGGATALLPVYASDLLHTGAWGLGLLRTAPAVGALVTSFYLAHFPLRRRVGIILFSTVMGFGVATVVFGVSTNLGLSIAALIVLGMTDMISMVIRDALLVIFTPDNMLGRVNAVNSLFSGTSNSLGEFESGVTAQYLGPVAAVLIGGVGTIAIAGLWLALFPQIRRVDSLAGLEGEPAPAA